MTKDVLIFKFRMEDYAWGYLPAMARETARARESLAGYGTEYKDWSFVGGHHGDLRVFFVDAEAADKFRSQWVVTV